MRAVFEKIAWVDAFDDTHRLVLLGSAQSVTSSSFLVFMSWARRIVGAAVRCASCLPTPVAGVLR